MAEIKNAANLPANEHDNYMLVGQAGSGKSTLAATLPGKTLVFAFDPAAHAAYAGLDHIDLIEYREQRKDLTPYSMKKELNSGVARGQKQQTGEVFLEFGADFNKHLESKTFDAYDNLVFDSTTTMQDLAMDAVLAKNNRAGQPPQMDDYMPTMNLITKVFSVACTLPLRTVFILHDEFVQDDNTKRFMYVPILIGKLKSKLPNKFNHLLRCSVEASRDKTKPSTYLIQTVPDNYSEAIRTSFKGLDYKHDVTVHDFRQVQNFGLGKIIQAQKSR